MSERKVKIELHTIAMYDGKEYELEELMNNIFEINTKLQTQLQQKENIIKEVREYIEKMTYDNPDTDFELEVNTVLGNALEILDKVGDEK